MEKPWRPITVAHARSVREGAKVSKGGRAQRLSGREASPAQRSARGVTLGGGQPELLNRQSPVQRDLAVKRCRQSTGLIEHDYPFGSSANSNISTWRNDVAWSKEIVIDVSFIYDIDIHSCPLHRTPTETRPKTIVTALADLPVRSGWSGQHDAVPLNLCPPIHSERSRDLLESDVFVDAWIVAEEP
jgi:hypothetical protein